MMAAARLNLLTNLLKINKSIHQRCWYSTKTATGNRGLVDKIGTTSDNSTFVAWHPEIDFAYEFTRPIPPQPTPRSSLIKAEALDTATKAFVNKHPEIVRQELCRVTFTTKHRWFPRARDKKAKKTAMNREYL